MKTWITTRTLAAAALVTFLPASGATLGIQPEPFRTGFFGVTAGQTLRMSVVNAGDVNEVAIERELADDRVDLTERQRHGRSAFHVLADEAIRGHADLDRRCGGVLHDGHAVLLGEREDAEDPAHAGSALVLLDVRADRADMAAGAGRSCQERDGGGGRPRRPIVVVNPMPPAGGAQMFA